LPEQLALDVAAVQVRLYTCCGQPAPPIAAEPPHFDHPHAEDCPNPNLGIWFDRFGRTYHRLHCITVVDGVETCPYGGRFPASPRTIDPHEGRCCLELRG
jgi:hypothetical protein